MNKVLALFLMIALSMPFSATAVSATSSNTDVTFQVSQLGGTYNVADSTGFEITFNQSISGLTANDITILEISGRVTRGALRGGGTRFILDISEVIAPGEVSISIRNFATFNVTTGSASVFVYKDMTIPLTFSATASPTNHTFETAEVGYNNAAMVQTFTITNTGTGHITGLTASLGGQDFWTPGLSASSIEPGSSATIGIRPRNLLPARAQPYTDTLTITGNNGISFTIPLSFTVIEPPSYEIKVSPSGEVNFSENMTQVFTIENIGTAAITNLRAALATTIIGEAVFEISAELSQSSLNPSQSATLSVRPVNGLEEGTHTDLLMIFDDENIDETINLTFIVSREKTYSASVYPAKNVFASAEMGFDNSGMVQIFTITNSGTETITNLEAALGSDAYFWAGNLSASSINPGATATIGIRPRNGLQARAEAYTDTLTITGDDGISISAQLSFTVTEVMTHMLSVSPTEKTFEEVDEGFDNETIYQTFTIRNIGTATITGLQYFLYHEEWGIGVSSFVITPAASPTTSIAPGQEATVIVRPKNELSPGVHTDVLMVSADNGILRPVELSLTVNRVITHGVVVDPPGLELTIRIPYDNAELSQVFTITNTGENTITNLTAELGRGNQSDFGLDNRFRRYGETVSQLLTDQSARVSLWPRNNLEPSATPYKDTLIISGTIDGVDLELAVIPLSLLVRDVAFYEASIDPEYKIFTAIQEEIFTVSNDGNDTLTGLTASLSNTYFEIVQNLPESISYGDSGTISIRPVSGLAPSDTPYTATLSITGDNDIELSVTLSFTVDEIDLENLILGDLNGDGVVNSTDLIIMLRFFSQPNTQVILAAADVNDDGEVDMADLILFLRFFAQPGIVLGPQ